MTWQNSAVRYVSVGEKSARFHDLTLTYTLDGDPVETVIWLPNGGGKSSLMSLHSAVVLPAARDFTGSGREDGEKRPRRLDDYVESGDTSHTVIEWVADDPASLFENRHRLLTGAVYEWPERRRPGTDQEGRLNKMWWSAVPIPGVLDLAHLPVRDGRLLTLAQFREQLRALNAEHPELQVRIATTQNAWEEQLTDLGLDTALYRYQARMNTSEGGIAKVFNFNSVRDFVDLIVDVIAHPDQAADCGRVFAQHAKNLFRRPALQTERAFLTEAQTLLEDMARAQDDVETATELRDGARRRAERLRASLTLAAGQSEAAARDGKRRSEVLGDAASEARRERGRADGVRAELLRLAAIERHADAERTLAGCQNQERAARADLAAWAAAGPLVEAAGHDASAEELREQLRPERAERESLRARVDAFAFAARTLLEQAAASHDQTALDARDTLRAGNDRAREIRGLTTEQRRLLSAAERSAAGARALLDAHDRALAGARRTGLLSASETPGEARERHQVAAEAADLEAETAATAAGEHRGLADASGAKALAAAGDLARHQGETENAAKDEERLRAAHDRLAGDLRLVTLAEAEGTIDVWGDAARLRSALTDAVRDAEQHALGEAVEAAEDDRLLNAVDSSGLLPAPVATRAAAETLTQAGIVAETAWAVLSRDFTADARAGAAIRRPDVASGVVVQDDATRTRAVSLLASSPTLAHVPLTTAAELAAAAAGTLPDAALPTVPLHPGLHDHPAAATTADKLRSAGAIRNQRRADFSRRANSDRALLGQLATFLVEYPDSDSLGRATAATAEARALVGRTETLVGNLTAERDRQAGLATAASEQSRRHERRADGHRADATTTAVMEEAAGQVETHRATVAESETAAQLASERSRPWRPRRPSSR